MIFSFLLASNSSSFIFFSISFSGNPTLLKLLTGHLGHNLDWPHDQPIDNRTPWENPPGFISKHSRIQSLFSTLAQVSVFPSGWSQYCPNCSFFLHFCPSHYIPNTAAYVIFYESMSLFWSKLQRHPFHLEKKPTNILQMNLYMPSLCLPPCSLHSSIGVSSPWPHLAYPTSVIHTGGSLASSAMCQITMWFNFFFQSSLKCQLFHEVFPC